MDRAVGAAAAGLGHAVRLLLWFLNVVFYASGPLLLFYGIASIYRPAGYIAAGLMLIILTSLLDRKRVSK